jgi:hypothetical protein
MKPTMNILARLQTIQNKLNLGVLGCQAVFSPTAAQNTQISGFPPRPPIELIKPAVV